MWIPEDIHPSLQRSLKMLEDLALGIAIAKDPSLDDPDVGPSHWADARESYMRTAAEQLVREGVLTRSEADALEELYDWKA